MYRDYIAFIGAILLRLFMEAECVITTTDIATTNTGSAGSPVIRLTAAIASADATYTSTSVIAARAAGCSITATFASYCCQ